MENPTVQIIPEIEHAGDDRIYVHAMKPPTCIPFLLMAADRGEIMRLTSDRKIIFADGIEPKEAAEEFAKWASIYLANLLTAKPTPPTREAFDARLRGSGNQTLSIDELTERFYLVRGQRNKLIAAIQKIGRWSNGPEVSGECLHNIERIIDEVRKDVLGMSERITHNGKHDWCADQTCEICARRMKAQDQSEADLIASGGIVDAP